MRLKFLTLNIFNGEFLDACVDFLKKESPDIFVLQEVYNSKADTLDKKFNSFKIIKQEFNNFFCYYSPAYFREIDGYKVDNGNAIFSKFEIVEKETTFYYQKYKKRPAEIVKEFFLTARNLQHAALTADDSILNVFNTQGVWGLDGKDNKDRLIMSRGIIEQIRGKEKIILAGDFNVSPNTNTINKIEKRLTNVFKDKLKSTFNMKIKKQGVQEKTYIYSSDDIKGFSKAVVDMIFVSPDIKVINCYSPTVDVSDHYPLVAVLEV